MTKVIVCIGNERESLKNSRHNVGFIIADGIQQHTKQEKPARSADSAQAASAASEELSEQTFLPFERKESADGFADYEYSVGEINSEKIYLLKPLAKDPKDRQFKTDESGNFLLDDKGSTIPNPSFGFGDINHSGVGLNAFLQNHKAENIKPEDVIVVNDVLSNAKIGLSYVSNYDVEHATHNGIINIGNFIDSGFRQIEVPVGKPQEGESKPAFVLSNFDAEQTRDNQYLAIAFARYLPELIAGNDGNFIKKVTNFVDKCKEQAKNIDEKLLPNSLTQLSKLEEKKHKLESDTTKKEELTKTLRFLEEEKRRIEEYKNFLAINETNPAIVKISYKLLQEKIINSLAKEENSENAKKKYKTDKNLTKAIEAHDDEVVRQLTAAGVAINEKALKAAIDAGSVSILKILIEKLPNREMLKHQDRLGNTLLHYAENTAMIETLLACGLDPDVKNKNRKTAILTALELATQDPKNSLPIFYTLLSGSKTQDENLQKEYHKFAKDNQEKFALTKDNMASELEISKLPPHKLIKYHYRKKLEIFTPYSDKDWVKYPKQALEGFGCEVATPQYNIGDDKNFESAENLEQLTKQIKESVAKSHGLVILGNNGNIDQKFFDENFKIDFNTFGQRRTFVEMVAFAEATRLGKPIWTICGGTQMALTLLGGKIEKLATHQDLRGSETDKMNVTKGSVADPSTHSKNNKNRSTENLPTWSAHYQGLAIDVTEDGQNKIFMNLPKGISVIAASSVNSEIPKIYDYSLGQFPIALMAQNHLENLANTNSTTNKDKSHYKIVKGFVARCANEQEMSAKEKEARESEAQKLFGKISEKFAPMEKGKVPNPIVSAEASRPITPTAAQPVH